jgi:hypothetical protein
MLALAACPSLKSAPDGDAGPGQDPDAAAIPDAAADDASDAGAPDAKVSFASYDHAARTLAAMRLPGPSTVPGSSARCTPKQLFWRDPDGSLHSWSPPSLLSTDYTFKSTRLSFVPSDAFVVVDTVPSYATLDVYQSGVPSTLVDSIPYAFNYVASDDGVIRLDQRVDDVDLNGTKVRRWLASTKQTEDITGVLPTKQPPLAFASGQVVIPGDVTVPYPLHVVDVKGKTASTITFDAAITLRQALPSPSGLLVAYGLGGGLTGLRLHKGNKDDAASRVELGDQIAAIPGLFPDSPPDEHRPLSRVATYGKDVVVLDSAFGVFAYDMAKGALVPLQLGADRKTLFVDVMCVLEDAAALVFRVSGDPAGQIWWLSLPALLP